jgi:putative glycosyltransferase (TIGR04372 family)
LLETLKRELHICASLFGVRSAHAFCRRFGWERYIFTKPEWNNIDPEGLLTIEEEPPSLAWHKSFMSSKAWLEDISQGRPIACVHVRDSAYTHSRQLRELGDPQEQDFRNPPIETFVPAVRKLISSGYFVFRMGSLSHHSFPIASDFFFDYAKSHQKSDFLDIFLVAQCSFFMGTNSGFSDVPIIFGKRVLLTNCFPGMVRASYPKVTYLFVSLFSKRLERNLTNDEAAQLWHARHLESKHFQMLGLTITYNTHEQILKSVQALISQ